MPLSSRMTKEIKKEKCLKHNIPLEETWEGVFLCERCFEDECMTIPNQIPSGKNAITITRTGKRFPNKRFIEWREVSIKFVNVRQIPIDYPVSIIVNYWTGDKRRRDVPGMIDALWHLLEVKRDRDGSIKKDGFIEDDKFLAGENCILLFQNKGLDRQNPRVEIKISGLKDESKKIIGPDNKEESQRK